jgi:hypothetical protein
LQVDTLRHQILQALIDEKLVGPKRAARTSR